MTTATIYCSKDATAIQSSSNSWNGFDNHLPVGLFYGGSYVARSFVYYPLNFAGVISINSATLYLPIAHLTGSGNHCYGGNGSRTLYADRMTSDWGESAGSEGVWTNTTYSWNNRAGAYTGTNQASKAFTGPGTNHQWITVDVTDAVNAMFHGSANYGFILRNSSEADSNLGLEFFSRHVGGYTSYIVLDYSTNTTPLAPTSLAPTGDALNNNLTPTLTGSHADGGDGDTMGSYEIILYEDDGTTQKWDSGAVSATGATTFSKAYSGTSLTGNLFYRWKARTCDTAGAWGPYSALQRFKVNSVPNTPGVSISGTASDENTLTPTLYVTHSDPDASDSQMYGYQIVVTRTSDNATMWDTGQVTCTPRSTLSLTYAGTDLAWGVGYTFKAKTQDSNGAWSASFSSPLSFTTHAAGVPVSPLPTGGIVTTPTPAFTGSRASSADSLTSAQVRVYANDGTTLLWDSGTFTTGVTSTGFSIAYPGSPVLAWSTDYKWQAVVTSSAGGTSAWSAMQDFTIQSSGDVQCNAPLGSPITTLTPHFMFSRATNYNRYQLIVYKADGVTSHWASGVVTVSSGASTDYTYAGTALTWNTAYKWKLQVSSDGGATWGNGYSGLQSFITDSAGTPTLTAPINDSWQTTLTPTFTGTTFGSEVISTFRVYVYAVDGVTLIWDSGNSAGASTSFSKVYAGSALVAGVSYKWTASYVKASGAPGDVAPKGGFHINAAPSSPSNLVPVTGAVIADTLTPNLSAVFEDSDKSAWGDTPTNFEVEVYRNSDSTLMFTLNKTSLVAGNNSVKEGEGGTTKTGASTLSYNVAYKARFRYTDSKSAVGAWSSYVVFTCSHAPTAAISTPGATIVAPGFTTGWSFSSASSKAQGWYRVKVVRAADNAPMYDSTQQASASASHAVPAGYLQNNTGYIVSVQVWDVDGLTSPVYTTTTASAWTAPGAPGSLSPTNSEETSSILLEWDQSNLSAADFSRYRVYRRAYGTTAWTILTELMTLSQNSYTDYTAGQEVLYQYKVTAFKKVAGDIDLESPDSDVVTVALVSDVWFVVGADASHIFELPVTAESHTVPIQQEVFEPLGTSRKVIVRGKVLGSEGSLTILWKDSERVDAQTKLSYLTDNRGPHILKSPFGDVWYVEFAGPAKKYQGGGALQVDISWIEVA